MRGDEASCDGNGAVKAVCMCWASPTVNLMHDSERQANTTLSMRSFLDSSRALWSASLGNFELDMESPWTVCCHVALLDVTCAGWEVRRCLHHQDKVAL